MKKLKSLLKSGESNAWSRLADAIENGLRTPGIVFDAQTLITCLDPDARVTKVSILMLALLGSGFEQDAWRLSAVITTDTILFLVHCRRLLDLPSDELEALDKLVRGGFGFEEAIAELKKGYSPAYIYKLATN